jgi:hypothetical protein
MNRLATALRAIGPYAAIELLLPGGSLVALSVWGYRNRSMLAARARRAFSRQHTPFGRPFTSPPGVSPPRTEGNLPQPASESAQVY